MKHLTDYITESKPKAINEYMIDEGLLISLLGKLWGWLWGSLTEKLPKDKETDCVDRITVKPNKKYKGKATDYIIPAPKSKTNKTDVKDKSSEKTDDTESETTVAPVENTNKQGKSTISIAFMPNMDDTAIKGIIKNSNPESPGTLSDTLKAEYSYNDGRGFWSTNSLISLYTNKLGTKYGVFTSRHDDNMQILAICFYKISDYNEKDSINLIHIEPNHSLDYESIITACIDRIINSKDKNFRNATYITYTPMWKEDKQLFTTLGFKYDKEDNILVYKKRGQ